MSSWQFEHISECVSTNLYVKELRKKNKLADKTAILTEFQTGGKGQGNNRWHSDPQQNMLCSYFKEINMKAEDHFILNMLVSLSISDLLKTFGYDPKIKWPNDIYIDDKKIAGILIENSLMNTSIISSIIGIGLNVNQKKFPGWIPNPVSLAQLSGKQFEVKQIAYALGEKLLSNLELLSNVSKENVYHKYLEVLYRKNKWCVYQKDGHNFNGLIRGVLPDGRLILETAGGQIMHFSFGEIEYVN